MSALPEWIKNQYPHPYRETLIEALSIAWGALEKIKDVTTAIDKTLRAKESMRRIAALGKE